MSSRSTRDRRWSGQADPHARWHCLHVWRKWPAADAIAMGQPFAFRAIEQVLVDLAKVYLETMWPGGRRLER